MWRDFLREMAALGRVLANVDGNALRGARDAGARARTRMKVSAYATLLTLAVWGAELKVAIEALGLIAL